MNSVSLNKLQYAIASLLFERLHLHDPVTPLEYSLAGDFNDKFYALAGVPENVDEPVSVVSTLPKHSRTVFIALTKRSEIDVARLLSNLEDIEREKPAALRPGEVVGFGGADNEFPPAAVIVMPVAVSHLLRELPDDAILANEKVSICFVLPLTERELDCRNKLGHDALIDMFQREGKSLFFA